MTPRRLQNHYVRITAVCRALGRTRGAVLDLERRGLLHPVRLASTREGKVGHRWYDYAEVRALAPELGVRADAIAAIAPAPTNRLVLVVASPSPWRDELVEALSRKLATGTERLRRPQVVCADDVIAGALALAQVGTPHLVVVDEFARGSSVGDFVARLYSDLSPPPAEVLLVRAPVDHPVRRLRAGSSPGSIAALALRLDVALREREEREAHEQEVVPPDGTPGPQD